MPSIVYNNLICNKCFLNISLLHRPLFDWRTSFWIILLFRILLSSHPLLIGMIHRHILSCVLSFAFFFSINTAYNLKLLQSSLTPNLCTFSLVLLIGKWSEIYFSMLPFASYLLMYMKKKLYDLQISSRICYGKLVTVMLKIK